MLCCQRPLIDTETIIIQEPTAQHHNYNCSNELLNRSFHPAPLSFVNIAKLKHNRFLLEPRDSDAVPLGASDSMRYQIIEELKDESSLSTDDIRNGCPFFFNEKIQELSESESNIGMK